MRGDNQTIRVIHLILAFSWFNSLFFRLDRSLASEERPGNISIKPKHKGQIDGRLVYLALPVHAYACGSGILSTTAASQPQKLTHVDRHAYWMAGLIE